MVAGSAGADFTLTLKDVYENLISGKTVTFQALNSTTNDVVSAITFEGTGSENGVYARKMKGSQVGVYKIRAVVDGINVTSSGTITITATGN